MTILIENYRHAEEENDFLNIRDQHDFFSQFYKTQLFTDDPNLKFLGLYDIPQ
jgi:hypothetical protein